MLRLNSKRNGYTLLLLVIMTITRIQRSDKHHDRLVSDENVVYATFHGKWVELHYCLLDWMKYHNEPYKLSFFRRLVKWSKCYNNSRTEVIPWAKINESLGAHNNKVSGIIFHHAHAGSTLVANMFGGLQQLQVYSESFVNAYRFHEPGDLQIFTRFIDLVGPKHEATVLKLSSYETHRIDVWQRELPQTPWIFVYRDLAELLATHMDPENIYGYRVPQCLKFHDAGITALLIQAGVKDVATVFDICAASLTRELQLAINAAAAAPSMAMFVNYAELPAAVWQRVAPHFELHLSSAGIERMRTVSEFDSKGFRSYQFNKTADLSFRSSLWCQYENLTRAYRSFQPIIAHLLTQVQETYPQLLCQTCRPEISDPLKLMC